MRNFARIVMQIDMDGNAIVNHADGGLASAERGQSGATMLEKLNKASETEFLALLDGIVEHAPWVTARAFAMRPFQSRAELSAAIATCIKAATPTEQLSLLRGHPELAGTEAIKGEMTPESTSEQGRLGLTSLGGAIAQQIREYNAAYREKFGFPFIVALRHHANLDSIFAAMRDRYGNSPADEIIRALDEVAKVVGGRIERLSTNASSNRSSAEHIEPGAMSRPAAN